ncbi:cold shock CspA family protein [Pseudomonas sp. Y3 TE3536]
MIEEWGMTGKVVEYDEDEEYGHIDKKHGGRRVYLPFNEAKGKGLKDGIEVTFDIKMVGDVPYAINVKRK